MEKESEAEMEAGGIKKEGDIEKKGVMEDRRGRRDRDEIIKIKEQGKMKREIDE